MEERSILRKKESKMLNATGVSQRDGSCPPNRAKRASLIVFLEAV